MRSATIDGPLDYGVCKYGHPRTALLSGRVYCPTCQSHYQREYRDRQRRLMRQPRRRCSRGHWLLDEGDKPTRNLYYQPDGTWACRRCHEQDRERGVIHAAED